jgi:hypothetical protein
LSQSYSPEEVSQHRGLTVREFARRYRVGRNKVMTWIKAGVLPAVNTATHLCGKPRYVIGPDGVAAWKAGRNAGAAPAAKPQRRRHQPAGKDFYPGD